MSYSTAADAAQNFQSFLVKLLSNKRGVDPSTFQKERVESIPTVLTSLVERLRDASKTAEADALDQAHDKVTRSPSFGGLGLSSDDVPTRAQYDEAIFLCEAWLESIESQRQSKNFLTVNTTRPAGSKPMTLAQKIFTQHALGSREAEHGLAVGDVVRVGVDWVIASELSWAGMAATYEELGSPGIWRNDRFWIAGDHVVHPSITDNPKIKAYIETAEKAKKDFRMTEYQGMNYTIMFVKPMGISLP